MIDLTTLRTLASKKRWSRHDAEQLIDGWRTHGGLLAGFARVLGCEYERLRRWSKLLDQAEPPEETSTPRFFEVRPAPPTHPFEVVAGNVVVRVPPDFDPATLRRLLTTLDPC